MNFARQLQSEGAVKVEVEQTADAPIERLFELLDFSAPGNAFRERGFLFLQEPVGCMGRFRATNPVNPDIVYVFDVIDFQWPSSISLETRFESDEPLSAVIKNRRDYTLTSTGPDSCRINLVERSWLKSGLSHKSVRMEHAMRTLSVQLHITRLCVHAALGVDEADKLFP
ncbi:hypothetical protein WNY37_15765 [Henriciella sp. AS95]|uniref:hypothetical protein n=1 Tax=Henriciella sp. AS95 TaxID=3135782 RepID=UPI00317A7347